MAARENQGLQIALVMFVVLTISVSVATLYFFRQFEEAALREKAALAKAQEALASRTVAQEEALEVKKILGAESRETLQSIVDNYQEDMQTYGANFKDADRHYRQLIKYLHTELAAADARFVDARQREEELKAKLSAEEQSKLAEVAHYQDGFQKSVRDLTGERARFNDSRDKHKKTLDNVADQVVAVRTDSGAQIKKLTAQVGDLEHEVTEQAKTIQVLLEKLKQKEDYADLPRGLVTAVNQRQRVAWINLGAADGLRRQITFKVLGADETRLADGKGKASLEVVRLLDNHLAEARIVDDDLSNPILPGDQLFSRAWAPGRVIHFALAGFMDINDDHESDRRLIRNLILDSGGAIDAEVADDGQQTGEITLNTRYLILGTRPTDKSSAPLLAAFAKMTAAANDLGVETISAGKFLDNIGYQPGLQLAWLDRSAGRQDTAPRPLGGVLRQSNPPFKPRPVPAARPARPSAYSGQE